MLSTRDAIDTFRDICAPTLLLIGVACLSGIAINGLRADGEVVCQKVTKSNQAEKEDT